MVGGYKLSLLWALPILMTIPTNANGQEKMTSQYPDQMEACDVNYPLPYFVISRDSICDYYRCWRGVSYQESCPPGARVLHEYYQGTSAPCAVISSETCYRERILPTYTRLPDPGREFGHCNSYPCKNNGVCHEQSYGFWCSCPEGHRGSPTCDIDNEDLKDAVQHYQQQQPANTNYPEQNDEASVNYYEPTPIPGGATQRVLIASTTRVRPMYFSTTWSPPTVVASQRTQAPTIRYVTTTWAPPTIKQTPTVQRRTEAPKPITSTWTPPKTSVNQPSTRARLRTTTWSPPVITAYVPTTTERIITEPETNPTTYPTTERTAQPTTRQIIVTDTLPPVTTTRRVLPTISFRPQPATLFQWPTTTQQPTPAPSTNAPVVNTRAPAVSTNPPVVNTNPPVFNTNSPVQPNDEDKISTSSTSSTTSTTAAMDTGNRRPSTTPPPQSVNTNQPMVNTNPPAVNTNPPATSIVNTDPTLVNTNPSGGNANPTVVDTNPTAGNTNPNVPNPDLTLVNTNNPVDNPDSIDVYIGDEDATSSTSTSSTTSTTSETPTTLPPIKLGDACQRDNPMCQQTIAGAVCRFSECQCGTGYVPSGTYQCVAESKLGERCSIHAACSAAVQNSECINNRCQCKTGYSAFANFACFIGFAL